MALLVAPRSYPYRALLARRLELKIIDSVVVAACQAAHSTDTEGTSQSSDELCVSEIMALKARLPPREKASWVALLRSCHEQLHGRPCRINGCPVAAAAFPTSFQRSLRDVWESADVRAARRTPAAAATTLTFDFLRGIVVASQYEDHADVRLCPQGHTAAATPRTAEQLVRREAPAATSEVVAPLELEAGTPSSLQDVRLRLLGARPILARSPTHTSSPQTDPLRRPVRRPVRGRSTLSRSSIAAGVASDSSPDEDDEAITIDELRAEALCRRSLPARASARSAESGRERSEQELEQAVAAAEADEAERRTSWKLAQQLEAERLAREEAERCAAAAKEAARGAEQLAAQRLARQKALSASALDKAREGEGYWRGIAAEREQQLYETRRQPDAQVRSANASAMAARAAAERRAMQLEGENARLQKGWDGMRTAHARERTNRKAAEGLLFEEREQHEREKVEALRRQDAEMRSRAVELAAAAAAATAAAATAGAAVEQLAQKLERARQLRGSGALQEVERCEAELEAAHAELEASRGREARANSLVTSLRRNQSAKQACSPLPPLHRTTASCMRMP